MSYQSYSRHISQAERSYVLLGLEPKLVTCVNAARGKRADACVPARKEVHDARSPRRTERRAMISMSPRRSINQAVERMLRGECEESQAKLKKSGRSYKFHFARSVTLVQPYEPDSSVLATCRP